MKEKFNRLKNCYVPIGCEVCQDKCYTCANKNRTYWVDDEEFLYCDDCHEYSEYEKDKYKNYCHNCGRKVG